MRLQNFTNNSRNFDMKAPDKIYLTNGDREHLINFDSDAANGLVMWCEDKITDHDVEYIRKDALVRWIESIRLEYDLREQFDRGADSAMEHVLQRIASL